VVVVVLVTFFELKVSTADEGLSAAKCFKPTTLASFWIGGKKNDNWL
jgi:hypothetical protein